MQPIIQRNSITQTTPRTRLNSTEQTTTLMKLKIFQNMLHVLMNVPYIFQNLSRNKTGVINSSKIHHIW